MRVAGFDRYDLHNTPGSDAPAFTLWFAGCSHKCRGCQNQELWDKNAGKEYDVVELVSLIFDQTKKSKINTVVLLGGEPLEQDLYELAELCNILDGAGYKIWLYTGYDYTQVSTKYSKIQRCLEYIKCGKYDDTLLQPEGTFPITSNQELYHKSEDGVWTRVK